MERRQYRHKKKIIVAMVVLVEVAKELGQTGVKTTIKTTSAQKRMPMATSLLASINNFPIFASFYGSHRSLIGID